MGDAGYYAAEDEMLSDNLPCCGIAPTQPATPDSTLSGDRDLLIPNQLFLPSLESVISSDAQESEVSPNELLTFMGVVRKDLGVQKVFAA